MFRTRILMLLGGSLLAASAALADDIGFVDCSNHSEATEVFGKPRKSQDIVATVPCGERFVVVTYGFIFSRIQTRAGQVGYVYSSLISVDRAAATLPAAPAAATPSIQMASEKTKVPSTPKTVAPSKPSAPAVDQQAPASTQAATAQPSTSTPATQDALVASTLPNLAPAQPQLPVPDSTSSGAAAASTASAPAIKPDAEAKSTSDVKPSKAQLEAQADAALATSAPTATSAPSQPATTPASDAMPKAPEPAATPAPASAQPDAQPAAPAQPEASAPVEPAPAPAPIRASERTTWEKPLPSARKTALFDFYGGYAFVRMAATTANATNMGGALGAVGWNFKSWLQFVGDTSYTVVTGTGTKNVLYGNHFGARYFYRNHNRYGLTPFVEGFVGGSRSDVTVSGVGGYTTSANCLSYKVGGGLDFHPMRHIDIRVFDVDYYRTSFGSGQQQNNYWASAGIVIHLFGGGEQ